MSATWQTRKYSVTCPTCLKERIVSRVQYWRLNKGLRKECKSCSVTGRVYPERAGRGFSPQAKEAQRKAVIGNKFAVGVQYSDAERTRRSEVMKGNKYNPGKRGAEHHSWRGGKGTERHRAMGQLEYKQWRNAVFHRDNFTCQMCDAYGGYLHADHIKPWAKHPELRYELDNGRTLCRACHFYITFKRKIETTSQWGLTSQEK